jgi:hypothetical protein
MDALELKNCKIPTESWRIATPEDVAKLQSINI